MTAAVVASTADLVALRRRQFAVVVDALDAALALENLVQEIAATHLFATVEQFLRCAPTEETRAHWAAFIDRATARIPTDL